MAGHQIDERRPCGGPSTQRTQEPRAVEASGDGVLTFLGGAGRALTAHDVLIGDEGVAHRSERFESKDD
jgi:hypothetical protein